MAQKAKSAKKKKKQLYIRDIFSINHTNVLIALKLILGNAMHLVLFFNWHEGVLIYGGQEGSTNEKATTKLNIPQWKLY